MGEAFGDAYMELKKMGYKHGGIFALNTPVYVPVDSEIIKRIIITDAGNFIDHGFYLNYEDDPLSAHMFNLEGNRWKDIRINLARGFSSTKLRKMFGSMVELSENLSKRLDFCIDQHPNGINIRKEVSKFTADVISVCGYGIDTNIMKGENSELIRHAQLFFDYQWGIYKNSMVFAIPKNVLKMFKFKTFKNESTEFIKNLFDGLKKYRKEHNIQRDDFANIMLELSERHEDRRDHQGQSVFEPLNTAEFLAQMWVFFCGSYESSSTTVTFALYELARNPEFQRKLRDEVNAVLSKYNNELTYEAIQEMQYMSNVIDGKYPIFECYEFVSD